MLIPTLTNEKRAAGSNRDALEFVLGRHTRPPGKDRTDVHIRPPATNLNPH